MPVIVAVSAAPMEAVVPPTPAAAPVAVASAAAAAAAAAVAAWRRTASSSRFAQCSAADPDASATRARRCACSTAASVTSCATPTLRVCGRTPSPALGSLPTEGEAGCAVGVRALRVSNGFLVYMHPSISLNIPPCAYTAPSAAVAATVADAARIPPSARNGRTPTDTRPTDASAGASGLNGVGRCGEIMAVVEPTSNSKSDGDRWTAPTASGTESAGAVGSAAVAM